MISYKVTSTYIYYYKLPLLQGTTLPSGTALISSGSLPPYFFKMYIQPDIIKKNCNNEDLQQPGILDAAWIVQSGL